MGTLSVRIRDYSDEYTNVSFRMGDLVGLDVWSLPSGIADGLEAALAGAIKGELVSITFSQPPVENPDQNPGDPLAQRENGLRISFVDNVTGDHYGVTIGTADVGALAQQGTDLVPLDHAEVAPIVTWMETNAKSKNGNAITCESAKLIGRNN